MKLLKTASALVILFVGQLARLEAATPAIQWTTQLDSGSTVFAVDSNTNVYVQDGTNVVELDRNGAPFTTIPISAPGAFIVKRDSGGNFYYAGKNPGSPSGTFTCYSSASPSFFMGKLSAQGVPLWLTNFGFTYCMRSVAVGDLGIDENGNAYLGYFSHGPAQEDYNTSVWKMLPDGTTAWNVAVDFPYLTGPASGVFFGPLWSDSGTVSGFAFQKGIVSTLNLAEGTSQYLSASGANYAVPSGCVGNQFHQFYEVQTSAVNKYDSTGNLLWTKDPLDGSWALAPDALDGLHVAGPGATISRIDYGGNLAWSLSVTSTCNAMVLDSFGNRFFSLTNGIIARLGNESVSGPAITTNPSGQTIMAGSNFTFSVVASGSEPLTYFWIKDGTPVSGQNAATLPLVAVSPAQAGYYSVIVSNLAGSVTSTPALLRVKNVAIFAGEQLLTNGTTYVFAAPITLNIRSAYTNGSTFYTLDGSAPTFDSIHYVGPFTVSASHLVRALGYSADFSQSEEADAVNINVLANHTITATSDGGGTVSLNPPGGVYVSTNIVTVTATPASGWSFMYWLGDTTGGSAVIQVPADRDRTLRAVFGTSISTTVTGNGQVQLNPADSLYPYGANVRVTGIPQSGSYFGFWGNAASGNTNPLLFTVTNANPTISSIFGTVGAGQSSLTILISGDGSVSRNPAGNVYSTSQTVSLTATPNPGQTFLGWSGDISGTQNPYNLSMSQNRTVTANFSTQLSFSVGRPGIEGFTPSGFRMTLNGSADGMISILGSSNLLDWQTIGSVSKSTPEVQFLDTNANTFSQRFYKARLP